MVGGSEEGGRSDGWSRRAAGRSGRGRLTNERRSRVPR